MDSTDEPDDSPLPEQSNDPTVRARKAGIAESDIKEELQSGSCSSKSDKLPKTAESLRLLGAGQPHK